MEDRICLLDQIRNKEINFDEVIGLVMGILPDIYYDFNRFYVKSKYCVFGRTLADAISKITKKKGNSINEFLNFYELIDAIAYIYQYNGHHEDEATQIERILSLNLEKTGWYSDFDFKTQQSILRRKDLKAEVVASTQTKSVQNKIYNYLSIRDGMIDEKRTALKSLIDDVDTFCKKNSSNDELKKAKHFYQCIRHPKDDPVKEFAFYYKDEEKWLDFTFQMVLDILSFEDLKKRIETIIAEEKVK